ncbi:MAG TPA: hypothetical protein VFL36_01050 [Myxococcales bacterium]|nr:hypothetical protein [Myxococcales bacterium]
MRMLWLAFLAVAGSAHAITLDELLARNLAARGGAAKVQNLKTLRLTGRAVFTGGGRFRGRIEMAWAQVQVRPGKIRSEVTRQGLTAVQAWNGKEGWKLAPFGGRREPERASQDDARALAQDADLEGHLISFRQKGSSVEYLGVEDVDGTPAHKLRIALEDGDVQYVYLDPDAFLEIRTVTERHVRGTEQVTETDLGAYGQVAGVWIPTSIDQGPKGAPRTAHFIVEKAEPNVQVDPRIFEYPQGTIAREVLAGPGARPPSFEAPHPQLAGKVSFDEGVISGLGARNIGSAAMSGRVSAVAARNVSGKTLIYVGSASGGVWKSQDGGTKFKPVFDREPVQSIGAVTIDPGNPDVVWVGTGETWTRNSVSVGDGIYKSTDAGETWTNMGLRESERIARIVVHPKKSNTVYACVTGKLWSDSKDRGVYRTTDGGKTWSLVLTYFGNASTGCSSLTMDPQNPDVLFAGLWDFRRKGWTFRSGGEGPGAPSGSALLRTADGGRTWTQLNGNGLPAHPWGRVEVVIAPSRPKRVYAFIESEHSALYRSDDGGRNWVALDRSQSMVWRPFYFARLVVDPTNPDRLFKTNLQLIVSEDGGRSFSPSSGGAHGDWHDLWIDPQNPRHVIGGDDGGLWQSYDGGSRWWKQENLPISQFYHVAVDGADPYHVYGGLQDNSTWVGDTAYGRGIGNSQWENLYGGDGFWAVPDTSDPEAVYVESQGGFIGRVDRRTMASRGIQPEAGYKEKLRFNWNAPIAASPTQKGVVYIGAQFLFRSKDRGDTWERISPDLTTNDPEKQKQEQSGGITVDNSSAEMHTTITVISESPLDPNTIWVGTDDGNVQVTRDGGGHWTNVVSNVAGLPAASWVSWVEASRFDPGTAYATFDRHTFGDMTPWVYRTRDFGKTWTRIGGPALRGYAHVIKEDTVKKDLLFLGTELGLFISPDGGSTWADFRGGDFPRVAVRDLQIHPREGDLVLATHGRGIWIVDDLSPLRALSQETLAKEVAFLPGRTAQERMPAGGGWSEGDATFVGENPPNGATIAWYQRSRHLYGPIEIEVLDGQGKHIDTIPASTRRGLNRVTWSMQLKPPRVPRAATVANAGSRGPRVLPGTYTVRLRKAGQTLESHLEVALDRRATYSLEDRRKNYQAELEVVSLFGDMSTLVDRIDAAQKGTAERTGKLRKGDPLAARLQELRDKLEEVRRKIVTTKEGGAITGEERIREHTDQLYGALLRYEGKPAAYQEARIVALRRELSDVQKEFDQLAATEVKALDAALHERNLPAIPMSATTAEAEHGGAGTAAAR